MTRLPARISLAEPDTPFTHDGANPADRRPPDHGPPDPSLDALFRRHARWLTGMLRLRYGREAAEDLLQETFLRAARASAPDTVRHPRAWLLRIALNAARDQARRRAVRPQLVQDDDLREPGAAASQVEALLLKQVVLGLPRNLREVFLLSRFGGLTYAEIAQQCGVSVKTVEARMTKALRLCAARLRS
jgi:RNA polymerase sigma-70 factor (ECF subfamily)